MNIMENLLISQPDPFSVVLAVMYAFRNKKISKIHVQKAIYLASKRLKILEEIFEFTPYRRGYWSEEVQDVIEQLIDNGDLETVNDSFIMLSEQGMIKAEKAWSLFNSEAKEVFTDIAEYLSQLDVDELLLYMYVVHGGFEKSDVMNRLLSKRKQLALNMYLKGAISLEVAAKIAGLSLKDFVDYAKKMGVKLFQAVEEDLEMAEKL
jgi:uncharacterized protein YwgA